MAKKDVFTALRALEDAQGRLTPDAVVNAARDSENPLHPHFEWDDTKAAEAHRRNQARTLIKTVTLSVQYQTLTLNAQVYARDPSCDAHEQGYRNVLKLRDEPMEARAAIVEEMARVAALLRRARQMAVVLNMESALADLEMAVAEFVGAAVPNENHTSM